MGKDFKLLKIVKNTILGVTRIISVFFLLVKRHHRAIQYKYNPLYKAPKLKTHHIIIMAIGAIVITVFTIGFFNQYGSQTPTHAEYQDTYLDTGFWSTPPTNDDIKNKLYGENSLYQSGRDTKKCVPSDMEVRYLDPGTNMIPEYLSGNMIYVLMGGDYLNDYQINIDHDCTAIVAFQASTLRSTVYLDSYIQIQSGKNIILDALKFDGESDGIGNIHPENRYGVHIYTNDTTLHAIDFYYMSGFAVYLENTGTNYVYDSNSYVHGLATIEDIDGSNFISDNQFVGLSGVDIIGVAHLDELIPSLQEQVDALLDTGTLATTGQVINTENIETETIAIPREVITTGSIVENGAIVTTGKVIQTGSSISDLDDRGILEYFYGSGSSFISLRKNNRCDSSVMTVVHLQPGYNTLPNFLEGNTLYILPSGDYDTRYMINLQNDCTALVSLATGVVLHTQVHQGANIKIASGTNTILYNIEVDGSATSTGLIHSGNNYGVFISTPDNSIKNIRVYDTVGFGVYMENFDNILSHIQRFSNTNLRDNTINTPVIIPPGDDGITFLQSFIVGGYALSGNALYGYVPLNSTLTAKLLSDINISSVDDTIQVLLPVGTKLVNSMGLDYSGIFLAPKIISKSQTQSTFDSGSQVIYAFKIGSDQEQIKTTISAQVKLEIPYTGDGQNLYVYYSLEGTTRENIGLLSGSLHGEEISTNFSSNKFGLFAIVESSKSIIESGLNTGDINKKGEEYTGISLDPEIIVKSQIQSKFDSGKQVLYTFNVGSDQENITTTITTQMTLDIPYTGDIQHLNFYYSVDGEIRENIGSVSGSSNGDKIYVNFTTKKFGKFAIVYTPSVLIESSPLPYIQTGLRILSGDIFISGRENNVGPVIPIVSTGSIEQLTGNQKIKIKKDKATRKNEQQQKLEVKGFKKNNKGKFVGKKSLDLAQSESEILLPVVLQSTGTISNMPIEVEFPEGTIVKEQSGTDFTGILNIPQILDENRINVSDEEIVSAVKIGPNDQHLFFEDGSGNVSYATIKIPTPDLNIGESVTVNYSLTGINRSPLTDALVTGINGEKFVLFQTHHFTQFYLGVSSSTFTIANDAAVVTGTSVTLHMNVPQAGQMRFGNTPAARDAAGWLTYASTYARTLDGTTDGVKQVYASFSGAGIVTNVSDNIVLDQFSETIKANLSGLIDGSEDTTQFLDVSGLGAHFTKYNTPTTGVISGEQYMTFNGTNQYATRSSTNFAAYPFTFSARVRPSRLVGIQAILHQGRNNSNNYERGIVLSGNRASLVTRNTVLRYADGTTTLQVGKWYHIVGVFNSNTDKRLYVNGNLENTLTTSVAYSTHPSNQTRLGAKAIKNPDSYFSGAIDEVHIYKRSLTTTEISGLYLREPTPDILTTFHTGATIQGFSPDKTYSVTPTINGNSYTTTVNGTNRLWTGKLNPTISTGTYTITGTFMNVYGITGAISSTNGLKILNSPYVSYNPAIAIGGNVLATLTGFDPSRQITNNGGSNIYTFTGNGNFTFTYADEVGNTGKTLATVTRIDDNKPTATVIYSTTGITDQPVIATLTGYSEELTGINATGYTFTGNGSFTFTFQNLSGYTGETIATVTWINTTPIIYFTGATPPDGGYVTGNTADIKIGIDISDFTGFVRSRSGVAYDLYNSGLVFMSNLDNNADIGDTVTTVIDISNGNHTGTISGSPVWTGNGKWNGAYLFDGTNKSINIGTYNLTNFTVSARFYSSVLDGSRRSIIGDPGTGFEISKDTTNKIQLYSSDTLTSSTAIEANRWYHVAMVKNSAGTQLYIDGVLDASNTSTAVINSQLTLGSAYNNGQFWNGGIDEVRIYNYGLSSGDIKQLYLSNLQKVNSGNREFSTTQTGLQTGLLYMYTGTVYTGGSSFSTSRSFIIGEPIFQGTMGTGYISAGTTGTNGGNNYYQGDVDIQADIVSSIGLNTGTCMYTTGASRSPAQYSGTSTTGYCYKTGVVGGSNLDIRFSIAENTGGTGTSATGTYIYDAAGPTTPSTTLPTSGAIVGGTVSLQWSASTDVGIGLNGYVYQVSTGESFTTFIASGTVLTNSVEITGFSNATYYWRVYAFDIFNNSGSWSNIPNFIVNTDIAPPTLGVAEIYMGTTGYNNPNYYYKGTGDIRATATDVNGISGATCEYTTGSSRAAASRDGIYCYKTGLFLTSNITINFRVQDTNNNLGTGTSRTYIYDATAPEFGFFVINNNDVGTNITGVTLNVICPTDAGINGVEVAYGTGSSPTNRQSCTTTKSQTLSIGDGVKTVYMRFKDTFNNTTSDITDTITLDTIGPSIPVVLSPISGERINTGNVTMVRNTSIDTGIGLSGYLRQISTGSSFVNVLLSGTTSNTGIDINGLPSNTYYRRVFAFDALNNTGGRSSGGDFVVQLDILAPSMLFTGTTPSDGFTITGNNFSGQMQITETGVGLNQFIWMRSGVQYSLYDSGLTLMMNFDKLSSLGETDGNIVDVSSSANIGSGYGGVSRTSDGKYNGAYEFNATDAHILPNGTTGIVLGITHTISAWIYPYNSTGTIFSENGDTYFFAYDDSKLYYKDGTSTGSVNYTLPKNQWSYMTVVRNGSSVDFYVDGIQQGTTQILSSNNPMNLHYIGKESSVSDFHAFKGKIDEPRAYNRALTSSEIQQLYSTNFNKSDIGKWLFTVNYQCLRDTTHTFAYAGYASDLAINESTTGRNITVSIPAYTFIGPSSLDLGGVSVGTADQTLSGQFTGYFQVQDWKGTTGWYTTLQLPTAMIGSMHGGSIAQNNIYIKGNGIDNVQGNIAAGVYVNAALSEYTSFSGTQTYIKRDVIPNSCPGGVYGNKPYIKVDVPAYTTPDDYSGNFTYDLIY